MVGVGFSGKSTLSKKIAEYFNIPLVSLDKLFFDKKEELGLDEDSDEQWEMLGTMCKEEIREVMSNGQSVVFDNINLKRSERNELRRIAREVDGGVVVVYLDTQEELLDRRQEENKVSKGRHDVKQEYLDAAKADLEIPDVDEQPYIFKPSDDIDTFLASLPR